MANTQNCGGAYRHEADGKAWQIIMFGLTGGLIPCPAAITVLLLCLQLKEFTLGFALVLRFSIVVTLRSANCRRMSLAWAGSCAS